MGTYQVRFYRSVCKYGIYFVECIHLLLSSYSASFENIIYNMMQVEGQNWGQAVDEVIGRLSSNNEHY